MKHMPPSIAMAHRTTGTIPEPLSVVNSMSVDMATEGSFTNDLAQTFKPSDPIMIRSEPKKNMTANST
jgi:hypothetical protein